ncbi:biotin transporter BioY [Polycladidibacter hongkongensis]|uniref:biotin transporter BioY n=1 Tax=Polycladidibacter hongkongensis TaxID=1647556 RepID=UPI00082D3639|nr:biotin transporter BioY [Pseudovibrio hongkongensis]
MRNDRSLVLIALFAALIAALGQMPKFDVPFLAGVPITAQTLGVMLAGCVLGAKRGALSVILLLGLVAVGLPALSGGRGGIAVFYGITSGFLFGWVAGAFVTGLIMEKMRSANAGVAAFLASVVGGIGVVYLIGVPAMAMIGNIPIMKAIVGAGVFIPGDLIKAGITALVVQTLARGLPSSLMSRSS